MTQLPRCSPPPVPPRLSPARAAKLRLAADQRPQPANHPPTPLTTATTATQHPPAHHFHQPQPRRLSALSHLTRLASPDPAGHQARSPAAAADTSPLSPRHRLHLGPGSPGTAKSGVSSVSSSPLQCLSAADRTRLALRRQARRYQARRRHTRRREAMAMSAPGADAARRFFGAAGFAVAGASQDVGKYGYKLLAWYAAHGLPVTPINPKAPSIALTTLRDAPLLQAVASPAALPDPAHTSLSVVTPPAATRRVLREAADAGVRAVWLQPGSYGAEELALARELFESAVAGEQDRVGYEGWCVLVHGEAAMDGRGKI